MSDGPLQTNRAARRLDRLLLVSNDSGSAEIYTFCVDRMHGLKFIKVASTGLCDECVV